MPYVSPNGSVNCAKPASPTARSCNANDLFTVSEGIQCGNCLAVYESVSRGGKVLAYEDAIAKRDAQRQNIS